MSVTIKLVEMTHEGDTKFYRTIEGVKKTPRGSEIPIFGVTNWGAIKSGWTADLSVGQFMAEPSALGRQFCENKRNEKARRGYKVTSRRSFEINSLDEARGFYARTGLKGTMGDGILRSIEKWVAEDTDVAVVDSDSPLLKDVEKPKSPPKPKSESENVEGWGTW